MIASNIHWAESTEFSKTCVAINEVYTWFVIAAHSRQTNGTLAEQLFSMEKVKEMEVPCLKV